MRQHTYLVIRRVDENFVHDLEKARNIFDFAMYHALALRIIRPHQLGDGLHAPDVRIRSFENVLKLSQLGRRGSASIAEGSDNAHLCVCFRCSFLLSIRCGNCGSRGVLVIGVTVIHVDV